MRTDTPRPPHLRLGEQGEHLAARYLAQKGLILLDRNWRCPDGELDLVLTDGTQIVVCEVKTRTSDNWGAPAEAVDDEKADRIRRVAAQWRAGRDLTHVDTRYDIVAVLWPQSEVPRINHYQGVF